MYEIDVIELGAKGDGKTDDTAAIQEAIDLSAETGRPVFLRAGIYLCNTLYMRPEVVIKAEPSWGYRWNACGKTVIQQIDDSMDCQIDITTANGATLHGLSLMGTGKGECVGILSSKPDYGKMEDAYRIEDCCVSNYGSHAVFLYHVWCFSIRHCQFGHCGGDGLRVDGWDGFVIDNWFSGNSGAGYRGVNPNASVTMTGNRIEWNADGGIVAVSGSHYNITGNYIDRSGKAGIELKNMKFVTITGNVIYRSGKFQLGDDTAAQCILEDCEGVTFTGNTIKHGCDDNKSEPITPAWAIRLSSLTDCVVSQNVMNRGGTLGLIDDRGGHDNSIITQNVGRTSLTR